MAAVQIQSNKWQQLSVPLTTRSHCPITDLSDLDHQLPTCFILDARMLYVLVMLESSEQFLGSERLKI